MIDVTTGRPAMLEIDMTTIQKKAVLGQTNPVTGLLLPAPVREAASGATPQSQPTSPSGAAAQPGTSGMIR